MAYKVSDETQKLLNDFKAKDEEFKKAWDVFEQAYEEQMVVLEQLRESRNAVLDTATRALRAEADSPLCKDNVLRVGPFTATKKSSSLFLANMLMARIYEADLFDEAKAAGAIEVTTLIKYKEMKQFLMDRDIYANFEDCEDIIPLTTAISGPKPIGPFGGELKKK